MTKKGLVEVGTKVHKGYNRRWVPRETRLSASSLRRHFSALDEREAALVCRAAIIRHQYQRLELTFRRWHVSGSNAAGILRLSDDRSDFLESEERYIRIADQRVVTRAALLLEIADALDTKLIHRKDQDKWIRKPFPPGTNQTPLMLMKRDDSYLRWFVAFVNNRLHFT